VTQKPIVNILASKQAKHYLKSIGKMDNNKDDNNYTPRNEESLKKLFRNKGPIVDEEDQIR